MKGYGNMESPLSAWKNGFRDGVPIFLGYIAVSFTFGIVAKDAGLTAFQAVLMSATNLTSAGQFAALGIIGASSSYIEMALTQFIINLRYALMSCALSQKLEAGTPFFHRFFMALGITDEISGISVCKEGKLSPYYTYGATCIAAPGWVLGTFLGTVSGSILPPRMLSALGVALYGMFLAVIIPPAKGNKVLTVLILVSMVLSLLFTKLPLLSGISSGFKIILLTILIAGAAAVFFPVKEDSDHER